VLFVLGLAANDGFGIAIGVFGGVLMIICGPVSARALTRW
jgi:hypothetical protein